VLVGLGGLAGLWLGAAAVGSAWPAERWPGGPGGGEGAAARAEGRCVRGGGREGKGCAARSGVPAPGPAVGLALGAAPSTPRPVR